MEREVILKRKTASMLLVCVTLSVLTFCCLVHDRNVPVLMLVLFDSVVKTSLCALNCGPKSKTPQHGGYVHYFFYLGIEPNFICNLNFPPEKTAHTIPQYASSNTLQAACGSKTALHKSSVLQTGLLKVYCLNQKTVS